jgi:membrane protease YdiL (CAAX protease family)
MSDVSSNRSDEVKAPWKLWLGMAFVVLVFYGSQFLGGVLLSLYPLLRHWSTAQGNAWLSSSPIIQFLFILIAETITVGYKLTLPFIGFKRPRWRDLFYGLSSVVPYYILFAVLRAVALSLFPSLNVDQKQEIGFDSVSGSVQLICTFISLIILTPLAEEIMFRGFIYKTLRKSLSVLVAALITSLLFGAGHLFEGGGKGLLWIGALQTFSLSVVLVFLRQKTSSLWAGITLHASNNAIAFVYLFILHTH